MSLRRRAERRLRTRATPAERSTHLDGPPELLHELDVRQAEVELQTERVARLRRAFDACRRRYAEVFDASPVANLTIDDRGHVLESNEAAATMLGRPSSAIRRSPFIAFVPASEAGAVRGLLTSVMFDGDRRSREIDLLAEDGTTRTVRLIASGTTRGRRRACSCVLLEVNHRETVRSRRTRKPAPAQRQTLLVVEDERASREALEKLLRGDSFRVLSAADPEQAISLAAAEPIDVLLTDLRLPHQRGDQLALGIRRLHPEVRVIYLSGEPPSDTAVEGPYLEKPIDITTLMAILEQSESGE